MTTQQDRDLRHRQMEAAAGRRARPGVAPRADRDPGQGGRIALDLPPNPAVTDGAGGLGRDHRAVRQLIGTARLSHASR